MRIISGEFRNRRLHTPKDSSITRPIPDRVKESLFALLRGWTEGASVLDAFAGTGSIGLEAISRGAARCVFIERDKRIIELIRRNVEDLGCDERAEVVMGDALGPVLLSRCPRPVDLAFFDPPYPLVRDREGWGRMKLQIERVVPLLAEKGFLTLRTPWPFRIELPGEGKGGEDDDAGTEGGAKGTARYTPLSERGGTNVRTDDEDEEGSRRGRGSRSPRPSRSEQQREKRRKAQENPLSKIWEGDALREFEASGFAGADRVGDEDEHQDDAELGADGLDMVAQEDAGAEAVPAATKTEAADLTIAGAVGPETHVYGNTAIHLYMRKPGSSATTVE